MWQGRSGWILVFNLQMKHQTYRIICGASEAVFGGVNAAGVTPATAYPKYLQVMYDMVEIYDI